MATVNEHFTFTYDGRDVCLVEYLPHIFKNLLDYTALADSSGVELSPLYEKVKTMLEDQFITTASSDIVAKWESYLGITPSATNTLEERKFRILAKLNDTPPYTDKYLENRLTELCGKDNWRIYRDYDQYNLTVEVSMNSEANTETVAGIIRAIVPANLNLVVQEYRSRHSEVAQYTHAELAAYTHDDIKYDRVTQ